MASSRFTGKAMVEEDLAAGLAKDLESSYPMATFDKKQSITIFTDI